MSESAKRAERLKRAGASPVAWLLERLGGGGALFRLAERHVVKGSAVLTLPDGTVRRFRGTAPGPHAELRLRRWRALPRLASGSLGFARAYVDGDWDSPNLPAVFELASANRHTMRQALQGSPLLRTAARLRHRLRPNSLAGARRNIALHYDLGNAFYAAWLDPTMTYSSAVFAEGDDLEAAQRRKCRRLLDLLDVRPGQHILEIGSGWGGFAELAARERGARVTGLTLSREQHAFASRRIADAGLADRVAFKLQDYRAETGTYDHVVSIEMFEAVGERYWPAFFSRVNEALMPGGRAALQIICIEDALLPAYRRSPDFIQAYIFPGGMLPSLETLREQTARAGLRWLSAHGFADSYARTLALWRERFSRAFAEGRLPAGFDERFRRLWTYYLAYCEGAFKGGSIDVVQLALRRG